jgi:hypothetical protein
MTPVNLDSYFNRSGIPFTSTSDEYKSFSVIMDFIAFTDSNDEVLPTGVRTTADKHQ